MAICDYIAVEKKKLLKLFGKRLKTLRGIAGITQQTLADSVGVSKEHISRIERGENRCPIEVAYKASRLLRVEMRDLFSFDSESKDVSANAYRIFQVVASQPAEQQDYWYQQITDAEKIFGKPESS